MALVPYILILISAITHATWNLIARRAGGSQIFLGLSKLSEGILLAPVIAIVLIRNPAPVGQYWYLFVIGALFTTLNYIFLGKAYSTGGNLSVVYPVARSSALMFVPFMAALFLGESINWLGALSIALIILGLFTIQLDGFQRDDLHQFTTSLRHPSMGFALLAGIAVACYSLWDKHALSYLPAFVYFYGYTLLAGLAYLVMLRSQHSWQAIAAEFRAHRWLIPAVGVLNTFTYMLVLTALAVSKASYVVALRQFSIGIGALMGWTLLHEPSPLPKRIGLALLVIGCLLVSFAR
jgi:uncharacterized membrane protein